MDPLIINWINWIYYLPVDQVDSTLMINLVLMFRD